MTEKPLNGPCPVNSPDCKKGYFDWTHSECKGGMKVSNLGYLRCSKCNVKGRVIDWLFDCGSHGYKEASAQGLCYAMSTMLQLTGVDPRWVMELTREIWKQAGIS